MTGLLREPPRNEELSVNSPAPDVVEIPLLLPGWQVSALETAAHSRGQTAGQMVRDLLRDFIAHLPAAAPSSRQNQRVEHR
jgi:hypothetical protein